MNMPWHSCVYVCVFLDCGAVESDSVGKQKKNRGFLLFAFSLFNFKDGPLFSFYNLYLLTHIPADQ